MTIRTETEAPPQLVSITTSLEEALAVLATLEANTVMGLDTAPWMSLSATERELSLSVARRGLTARGLAQVDDRGQFLVHRALLTAVGICAYPRRTAFIDHWPTSDVEPLRVFIHQHGSNAVVHVPAGPLQHFHLVESEAELAKFLSATYGWGQASPAGGGELRMSRDEFSRAFEASAGGDRAAATRILTATNPADGVLRFVDTLSARPGVSIFQTITPSETPRPEAEETFTVLQSGSTGWLVVPVSPGASTPLRASAASPERLRGRLRDVLWAGS